MDFVKFLEEAKLHNETVEIWTLADSTCKQSALCGEVLAIDNGLVYLRQHEPCMIRKYFHIYISIRQIKAISVLSDRESFAVDSC